MKKVASILALALVSCSAPVTPRTPSERATYCANVSRISESVAEAPLTEDELAMAEGEMRERGDCR